MKPHLSDDGDIFHMEGLASVLPECDTRPAVDLIIWIMITFTLFVRTASFDKGDYLDIADDNNYGESYPAPCRVSFEHKFQCLWFPTPQLNCLPKKNLS